AEALPKDCVRESHRINAVAGRHRGGGIHYAPELHAADNLIPHIESRGGSCVPRSVAVEKCAARSAELKLHNGGASVWPFRSFKGIGARVPRLKHANGHRKEGGEAHEWPADGRAGQC